MAAFAESFKKFQSFKGSGIGPAIIKHGGGEGLWLMVNGLWILLECFRAPGFSIREQEAWAFDILSELGIKYDCSVFPAHHAHGGMAAFADSFKKFQSFKGSGIGPAIIKHGGVVKVYG